MLRTQRIVINPAFQVPLLTCIRMHVGLFYGHTGHVRFLTSVDLGRSVTAQSSSMPSVAPDTGGGGAPRRHATFSGPPSSTSLTASSAQRTRPITPPPLASVSVGAASSTVSGGSALIISGGDGFEDFRASSTDSESAGRDDSTNHLLLWRI